DSDLEPLRHGLGMGRLEFEEGIFCWKGFIYYKWTLADLLPKVRPVSSEISRIRPPDRPTHEDQAYIDAAKARLAEALDHACDTVRDTLKVYDDAYRDLTLKGQPSAFRAFLLKAPT
ncbi:MAG TPA: hypothetical protein PKB04_06415, partial [Phenylobacterium sp.]|nr:hypothetical protein [Phenylobacterium sp.]